MELETMHDREFYLAKAREHEMLEEVVTGTATMRSALDEVIGECDRTIPHSHGKLVFTKDLIEYLGDYFTLLSELSGEGVSCELGEDREWVHNVKGEFVLYAGAAVTTGIIFTLWAVLPVVGDVLATILCPSLLLRVKDAVVRNPRDKALQTKRDEILGPVYEIIDGIDQDISKCFIMDHYHNERPRFEETYRSLPSAEREAVDSHLHSYLGAGGMPGMDEIMLNDYLSGLLVPEAEPKPKGDA